MLTSKQTTLKPLLESRDGVHLTAYLVNRGHLTDLEVQLRLTILEASDWLSQAMTAEEQKKFLEPLESLLLDSKIFKQMKGNIGLFRNEDTFRILNIPIEVEQSCQVATSFHVKPLLRWIQGDKDFLFLGLKNDSAHLYLGSQDSFRLIDSLVLPESSKAREVWSGVNEWIMGLTKNSKPQLFVAGEAGLVQSLNKTLKYRNRVKTPISHSFSHQNAHELCQIVRKILKEEIKKSFDRALLEFRFANEGSRTRKNIFQIAKAVVQGKVRKLIVTDELNIFGKIDPQSGGLALHPFDLDHEDDCILDDLAQMVLSQGGEVIVAKRNEIPLGRPILAIMDDDIPLEKTAVLAGEALEERFR